MNKESLEQAGHILLEAYFTVFDDNAKRGNFMLETMPEFVILGDAFDYIHAQIVEFR